MDHSADLLKQKQEQKLDEFVDDIMDEIMVENQIGIQEENKSHSDTFKEMFKLKKSVLVNVQHEYIFIRKEYAQSKQKR